MQYVALLKLFHHDFIYLIFISDIHDSSFLKTLNLNYLILKIAFSIQNVQDLHVLEQSICPYYI